MENKQQLWGQCLQLIQQGLARQRDREWVFDTWFRPVTCESYDEQKNTVVLQVPSRYTFEYIEHYYMPLMKEVLKRIFGSNVRLQYRIMKNAYGQPISMLQDSYQKRININVQDAAGRLNAELHKHIGDGARWMSGYDKIAEWLSDNKGRGLLCIGTPGLGKTVVCRHILPTLLDCNIPVVSAHEMNKRINELLHEHILMIDDLGKEDVEVKDYGNRRTPFLELCDRAEQEGNLLIITTNLSTTPVSDPRYPASIKERYGDAVYSRLRALMTTAIVTGDDMRGRS